MHYVIGALSFALILGILVLVHEFGHFAVAKLCGVRVEAFAIGFGPRLFGVVYKGTDYRINALPLGGYVKMSGELPGDPGAGPLVATGEALEIAEGKEPARSDDPGEFYNHPRWQRVCIALAGPIANFILALFVLAFVAMCHHEVDKYLTGQAVVDYVPASTAPANGGMTAGDVIVAFNHRQNPTWMQIGEECQVNVGQTLPITYTHNGSPVNIDIPIKAGNAAGEFTFQSMVATGLLPREQAAPLRVREIQNNTPASRAGLQAGDAIVSIDGLSVHSVQTLVAFLQDRAGAPAQLIVDRGGKQMPLTVKPEKLDDGQGGTSYRIGFAPAPAPVNIVKLPFGEAMAESWKENIESSTMILRVLQGLFTRKVSVKSVSGPVGMYREIDLASQAGIWSQLPLMSGISVNLGIFNLLPFPILDGGMILFLLIESLMRRDVNQVTKERIYQVAFVCLILFAVFVFYNDITKLHMKL